MEILVDVNGADAGIGPAIEGAFSVINNIKSTITLVGNADMIKNYINENFSKIDVQEAYKKFKILDAKDVITNNDEPALAIKCKKESSIVKAYDYMKEQDDTLFISAGSTGAVMAGGLLKLKRIVGIHRPALITLLPTANDRGTMLLDCGANVEAGEPAILQYAQMGIIYAKEVLKKQDIKVALLNIGTEDEKGTIELKEINKSLRNSIPEFVGNIEAREILSGVADVVVTNGLLGNIALKSLEGTAKTMKNALVETMTKNLGNKIKALICKNMISKALEKYDYTKYGGAVLLGVRKPVIKIHGNAKSRNYKTAILQGDSILTNNLIERISNDIESEKETI